MTDDNLIEKIELSHSALANSISAYGDQTKRLQIRFDEVIEKLGKIEIQTTKTNGTVTDLRLWRESIKGWLTGVGLCIMIIIGLVAFIFNNSVSNVQATIEEMKKTDNDIRDTTNANFTKLLSAIQKNVSTK